MLIVSISLIVAAVGVANSMMTAVHERTPEIGLRRAVGASRFAIRRQFLFEAVFITSLGALTGVLAGAVVTVVGGIATGLPVVFNLRVEAFAALSCLAFGVLAGVVPAMRAASIDPVRALHHE